MVFCTEWRWCVFWAFDVKDRCYNRWGTCHHLEEPAFSKKDCAANLQLSEFCKRRTFKIDPERHSHWCSTFVRHPGRRHNFFRWNPFEGANLWFSMACRSRMVQEDAKAQVQQSSLLSPWYNYVLTHCKESKSGYDGSSQLGPGAGFENWYVLWYRIKQGRWQAPQLPPKNDKFARSVDSHAAELLTKHQQQIVTDSAARARSRVLHYELLTSWFCVRAFFFVSAISFLLFSVMYLFVDIWGLTFFVFVLLFVMFLCISLSCCCHVSFSLQPAICSRA